MEMESICEGLDYEFTKSFVMSAESTFKDLDGPSGESRYFKRVVGGASGCFGLLPLGSIVQTAVSVYPVVDYIDRIGQNNKKKMIRSALDVNSNAFQQAFQRLFTEKGVETFYEYNVHNNNKDGRFKIYAQIGSGENARGSEREAIQILGKYAGACSLNHLAITGKTATLSEALTQESGFRKFKSWLKLWTQDKLYVITKNKNGEDKKVFISAYNFFLKKSLATQIKGDHFKRDADPEIESESYKIRKDFTSASNPPNIAERLYFALLNDHTYTSTSDQEMWAQVQKNKRDCDPMQDLQQDLQHVIQTMIQNVSHISERGLENAVIKSTGDQTTVYNALEALNYLNLEPNKVNLEAAKKLEKILHGDLLALNIALAFILDERKRHETDGNCVQYFINEFTLKKKHIRKLSLQKQTDDSILLTTTLSLALDTIAEIGPAGELAVTMINCIAHLSDRIPQEFLCGLFQERENNHEKNELIADAIVLLLDYNLIAFNHRTKYLTCDLRLQQALLTLQQQQHQDGETESSVDNDTIEVKVLLEVAQRLQDFITYFKICDPHISISHLLVVADRIVDRSFNEKFKGFIQFVASVVSQGGKLEEALKYEKYELQQCVSNEPTTHHECVCQ